MPILQVSFEGLVRALLLPKGVQLESNFLSLVDRFKEGRASWVPYVFGGLCHLELQRHVKTSVVLLTLEWLSIYELES